MKFKELREANLSKAQINKVHDKADDLPKNDFIKRYGKDGDSVRFATATKMVKKELGIEDYEEGFKSDAQRKAAFASGYKEKGKKKDEAIKGNDFVGVSSSSIEYKQGKQAAKDGKKYDDNPYKSGNREMNIKRLNWSSGHNNFREELDDKDKETIKPIIKQLQKSVKAHDKQAKQLQKDIQDEVKLTEKKADYIDIKFNSSFEAKRMMTWLDKNISPVNNQLYDGAYREGQSIIQFEDVPNVDALMKKLKSARINFKVDTMK